MIILPSHKKVLLRERKRHTARHISSPWPGGGDVPWRTPPPILTWLGGVGTLGYPHPDLLGG